MQNIFNVIAGLYEPYDFETLTISSTASGLTASKLRPNSNPLKECQRVMITVEDASIRYRTDGSDPTSSIGHLANVGDIITLLGQPALDNFRAIRTGSVDASCPVTYER